VPIESIAALSPKS